MKRHIAVVALATVSMVAAACGDDSDSGDSSATPTAQASSPTTTQASAPTESSAATESPSGEASDGAGNSPVSFSDENKYKADVDRTGETIKIGVSNNEGATFTTPEMRPAILTAIDYINANGGVNGATLDPVECISDATPDGAINCANQFVEEGIDLVTYGAEINIDAALQIYEDADIAIVSDYAYNQTPSDHVWALTSPAASFSLYTLLAFKNLGATKPAFLPIDAPVFHYHADIWPKWADKIGMDSIVGPFVDASTADWSSAVQSVLADGADGLAYFGPANGAVSIVTAARQLGFEGPIITTDASYFRSVDEAAVQNNYAIAPRYGSVAAAGAAPSRIAENLSIYAKAMTDAGHEDIIEGNAENQFSTTIDIATILDTIPEGEINFESISEAMSQDRELPGFDAPDFNCGGATWPAAPSFCRAYQIVFKVERSGDDVQLTPLKEENGGVYNDLELNAAGSDL